METAIKMLYFSGMAYEHDEVGEEHSCWSNMPAWLSRCFGSLMERLRGNRPDQTDHYTLCKGKLLCLMPGLTLSDNTTMQLPEQRCCLKIKSSGYLQELQRSCDSKSSPPHVILVPTGQRICRNTALQCPQVPFYRFLNMPAVRNQIHLP